MQHDSHDIIRFLRRRNVNLDITHRCPLECPRCQRFSSFTSLGLKVPGEDMPFEEFKKIVDHFTHLNFCGQVSDPVHHPKFVEFLKYIHDHPEPKSASIHHASAGKPLSWYPKAFKANPKARWWFGIDGLPKDSHKYRINQDGEKLFEIMKMSREHLNQLPVWQYIVFKYNENDIDEAKAIAKDLGVEFMLVNSSRWLGPDDPYRPSKEHSLDLRDE